MGLVVSFGKVRSEQSMTQSSRSLCGTNLPDPVCFLIAVVSGARAAGINESWQETGAGSRGKIRLLDVMVHQAQLVCVCVCVRVCGVLGVS